MSAPASPLQDVAFPHEHHISPVQSAKTSIFCLPFDILYQIFLLLHTQDPEKFRFVASHVCQQWRAAALDCPLLWETVAFERRLPLWEKEKAFVHRSANAGLDIRLGGAPFKTSSIKTLKKIMRVLLPHTSRWKSLAITEMPSKIFRIFIDGIRYTTFPMLQTLSISGTGIQGRWRDPSLSWSMPALQNLSLDRSPFIHSSPIFNNLQYLCLDAVHSHFITAQRLQGVLTRSPALHTLETMDYSEGQPEYPNAHTHFPILHTNLRHLTCGPGLAEWLFALVQMPSLETWEANTWSILGNSASLRMITALSAWPSPCRITSFEVDGSDGFEEISSLRGALRVLPLLCTLRFNYIDFGDEWWPTDISTLCPRLKSLQLDDCSGVTGEEILSTVQRRSEGGEGNACITVVEIHGHPQHIGIEESVDKALRAIVELRLQEETEMGRACWAC